MKAPALLACLPGTQCVLQNLEKGGGFFDSPVQDSTSSPLPPPQEVFLPQDGEAKSFSSEQVVFSGGLTLLKGQVNTAEVLGIHNADLVPGKYEGGLKLWECATDLVDTLRRELQDGQLSFRGKRVLELGCGHGLPGIFACLKGASTVHFQDFNAEVLRNLTIPNVNLNLEFARARLSRPNGAVTPSRFSSLEPEVHFYAGDWTDVHVVLSTVSPLATTMEKDSGDSNVSLGDGDYSHGSSGNLNQLSQYNSQNDLTCQDKSSESFGLGSCPRKRSGSRACERSTEDYACEGGYDIILMSETVYSLASLPKLYLLIKKCLRPYYGVVYVAGKKHYFGVGGGTRQFKHLVEDDGIYGAHLVSEFADGCSNVREIWKFFLK